MKQENLKRAAEIDARLFVIETALNALYQAEGLSKNVCLVVRTGAGRHDFYIEKTHFDFEKIRSMNITGFMKERKQLLTELKRL